VSGPSQRAGVLGRVIATFAAVLLLAAVAASCGDDVDSGSGKASSTTASVPVPATDLGGTSWQLDSPVADTMPTLDFAVDGSLSGSTGCNRFSGTWTQDETSLTLAVGPMTQMACLSADATRQEQDVMAALPTVASARQTETSLTLIDDAGKDVLTYGAVSGDLAGTSWKVTGVNTGSAVETSALTEVMTLDFGTDGSASGNGGCNTFRGTYEQDGTTIAFSEFASTMIGCEPDVAEMEDKLLAALAAATTVERSGNQLTLRDDAGAMQVTATLAG